MAKAGVLLISGGASAISLFQSCRSLSVSSLNACGDALDVSGWDTSLGIGSGAGWLTVRVLVAGVVVGAGVEVGSGAAFSGS